VLLTVYALWSPGPSPPLDATPSAAEACGPHAPADATPVSLPVDSSATWHALRGVLVCFTHDLTITETFDLGRHGELLLADRRLYGDNTGLEVDDPALHAVRLGARQRPPAAPRGRCRGVSRWAACASATPWSAWWDGCGPAPPAAT
jgi:hypothetical protein